MCCQADYVIILNQNGFLFRSNPDETFSVSRTAFATESITASMGLWYTEVTWQRRKYREGVYNENHREVPGMY